MENILKKKAAAIPADVTPELITLAVIQARRWRGLVPGMYTLAAAMAAGWRGQPMRKECRPSHDGVGGDYWFLWDGGEVRQRTRTYPPSAETILSVMWEEYNRQTAAGR